MSAAEGTAGIGSIAPAPSGPLSGWKVLERISYMVQNVNRYRPDGVVRIAAVCHRVPVRDVVLHPAAPIVAVGTVAQIATLLFFINCLPQ
jgi:hypothetical protein